MEVAGREGAQLPSVTQLVHEVAATVSGVMGVGVRMVSWVPVVGVVRWEVGEIPAHRAAARIPRRQLHQRREREIHTLTQNSERN